MDGGSQNHSGPAAGAGNLDARSLNEALAGERFGRVLVVEAIDSTNSALFELGRSGEPEGLVILAEEQSGGRGRLGRSWVSPKGKSILMSVLVRALVDPERAGILNAAAGLAAVDAAGSLSGLELGLKWPNDVVLEGRKLGGILTEAGRDRTGDGRFWVVGIGLNVNWEPDDFPAEISTTATSLSVATGGPVDRASLVVHLAKAFGSAISLLEADPSVLLLRYRRTLTTLGQRVVVSLPAGKIEGVAEDLDEAGDLVVMTDAGEPRLVTAGDVTEVRPS